MPGEACVIRHYYHVYADGDWREAVGEHLAALATIDVPMHVTVGVVGSHGNRAKVVAAFKSIDVSSWIFSNTGWEQTTLAALREDSADHNDPVLYAHTKGAANPSKLNTAWRRSMTRRTVVGWRGCLKLADGFDAVGCHWLPGQGPPWKSFFAGNFWWSKGGYLRCLPELDTTTRWRAEDWIGQGDPLVYDLLPGWPSLELVGAP